MSAEKVGVLGVNGALYPVDETVFVDNGFPDKMTIFYNNLFNLLKPFKYNQWLLM